MEAIYFLFLFIFIISKVRKLFWNLNKTIKNFEDSNEHIIKPLCTNIFKDHATSHLTITKTSVVNEFLCMRVCVFALIVSYSLWPHGLQPSRLLCPWDFPGKNTGLPVTPSRDLPNPGVEPSFPALAGGSFIAELPGKPMLYVFYRNLEKKEKEKKKG